MFGTINLQPHFLELESNGWTVFQIEPSPIIELKNCLDQHQAQCQFRPANLANQKNEVLIRNDLIYWIPEQSQIPIEKKLLFELNFLRNKLKNYFRLPLTHFETHYAIYPEGHFYKKHIDQKENDNHRFISFVIYLNQVWAPDDGGELCGYKEDLLQFKIEPKAGQMILFQSDLLHEVLTSHKDRYSITGWFRT